MAMSALKGHVEYVIERSIRLTRQDDQLWPRDRRETYLLRESVEIPLSIDRRVLPMSTAHADDVDGVEITFAVVIEDSATSLLEKEGLGMDEILPRDLARLGYDVCDNAKYSALTNFGRSAEQKAQLASQWAAALNAHHLFANVLDARKFSKLASEQYPEHAPFSVVGLYVEGRAAARPSGARDE
jgi:hypothetical protein